MTSILSSNNRGVEKSLFFNDAMNLFLGPFQRNQTWYNVGRASDFPDITEAEDGGCQLSSSCKAYKIPKQHNEDVVEANISDLPKDLKDQVLVFKYKGKIHAIDHVYSMPLSKRLIKLPIFKVADNNSNVLILRSHFQRAAYSILKISESSSVLESLAPNTDGHLISFQAKRIVEAID